MSARAAALALVAALASCGKGTRTIERAAPQLTVRLLDPGAEPRRPLRYHPRPGAVTTYERRTQFTVHARGATIRQPLDVLHHEARVLDVDPRGAIHGQDRILDVTFHPAPGDAAPDASMRARAALVGAISRSTSDGRGRLLAPTEATVSGDVDEAQLSNGMIEAELVLPDEPVGVGARWELRGAAGNEAGGVTAQLVDARADRLDVLTTFDVTQGASHGAGTVTWKLDLAGPTEMHLAGRYVRADASLEVTIDDAPVPAAAK